MPDLQTVGLCLQTVRHRSTNCPTNFSIVPTNRHYCMRTYLIQNTLNTVCRVCRNSPTVCRTVCRTVCTDMNTVCRATPSRSHRRPRLAHAPDHAGPDGVKAGKRTAQWHLRAGEARREEGGMWATKLDKLTALRTHRTSLFPSLEKQTTRYTCLALPHDTTKLDAHPSSKLT